MVAGLTQPNRQALKILTLAFPPGIWFGSSEAKAKLSHCVSLTPKPPAKHTLAHEWRKTYTWAIDHGLMSISPNRRFYCWGESKSPICRKGNPEVYKTLLSYITPSVEFSSSQATQFIQSLGFTKPQAGGLWRRIRLYGEHTGELTYVRSNNRGGVYMFTTPRRL